MNLPLRLLLAGLSLVAAMVLLGFAVKAGYFQQFDLAVSHLLNLRHGASPEWLISIMWWISWFGGGVQRYIMVTMLTIALWRWWGWGAGLAMGLTTLLSSFASDMLKMFFARSRPELVPHLDLQSSFAYPSGHANNAAVVYILFIMLVPQARHPLWQLAALCLIVVTGISRIMLGVHWPTDVIGGWMLGTASALFAGAAIAWREHQKRASFPSVLNPHGGAHDI